MKRGLIGLAVAAALTMAVAGGASADKGGEAHEGSCGLGKGGAHEAIADQTSPGATEFARFPPSEAGCTGQNG
jgi:hypothetical protein